MFTALTKAQLDYWHIDSISEYDPIPVFDEMIDWVEVGDLVEVQKANGLLFYGQITDIDVDAQNFRAENRSGKYIVTHVSNITWHQKMSELYPEEHSS